MQHEGPRETPSRKRKRYVRKSTEQADRQAKSLEQQNEECDKKWGPLPSGADLYTDSGTGTTFDRADFQRLLRDCTADPQPPESPGRLELFDPSRFGRPLLNEKSDSRLYRTMLWQFEGVGWRPEFVTLERSSDPMTDEMQILFAAFQASEFSITLSKNVRRGKANHAREGYWIHGEPPRGTLRALADTIRVLGPDEEPDPSEKIIFTNRPWIQPDQVEVARVLGHKEKAGTAKVVLVGGTDLRPWAGAASRYLDGHSFEKVGEWLYAEGLRGKKLGKMDHTAVKNYLSNPALVGLIRYHAKDAEGRVSEELITAKWGPIVEPALWHAVQDRIAERGAKAAPKSKSREHYPLAAVCAHCQSPYWGSNRPGSAPGEKVRTLRHAPVDGTKHPDRLAWSQQYGCRRYDVDAGELEEAVRRLIARERSSPEFEERLRVVLAEQDTYKLAAERRASDVQKKVAELERSEAAAVTSVSQATTHGVDAGPFWKEVQRVQKELQRAREDLTRARRDQQNSRSTWDRIAAAINETRTIDEAWDRMTPDERGVIFRHWVVAVFIAVQKIEGRKRGHPRTAIVYLASAPQDPLLVPIGPSAASTSLRTEASASSGSRSSSAARADSEPICPSAHAECPRTTADGSDSAARSTGTASSDPQLPSATATLRRNPGSPALRTAEPRENASQPDASIAMRSISDGEAVPGCHPSEGNGSTPPGGSPGPRAANAGSDEGAENLRLKGHTS
jgi:DNA invertase Pin-like site-specific DNA recombinase